MSPKFNFCDFLQRADSTADSATRVESAWLGFMKTGAPIPNTFAARPMIPAIEAAARKLSAVANVNRNVHATVYNTLSAEAVAKAALERAAETAGTL